MEAMSSFIFSSKDPHEPETVEDVALYPAIPTEQFRHIKPSRLLIGTLTVIFGLFVINLIAIVYLNYDNLNLGQVIVSEKWKLLSGTGGGLDYLILGDSSANSGFDPAFVDETYDLHGLNLATVGLFGFVDDLWMLETYIEVHGVPEVVIIATTYDVGYRDVDVKSLLGTYAIPVDALLAHTDIARQLSFLDLVNIYQSRLFPLYYRRDTLAYVIRQAQDNGFKIFNNHPNYNQFGFLSDDPNIHRDLDIEVDAIVDLIKAGEILPEFSESNRNAILSLVSLAEEHDFSLYFINGPSYSGFDNNKNVKQFRQEYTAAYQELIGGSPNAVYIPEVFSMSAEQMTNLDHIVGTASPDYTQAVVSKIWGDECIKEPDHSNCIPQNTRP